MAEQQKSKLQKEYAAFFMKMLEKYGVDSPAKLDDEKKREFFNKVELYWEEGEGPTKEGEKAVSSSRNKEVAGLLRAAAKELNAGASEDREKRRKEFAKKNARLPTLKQVQDFGKSLGAKKTKKSKNRVHFEFRAESKGAAQKLRKDVLKKFKKKWGVLTHSKEGEMNPTDMLESFMKNVGDEVAVGLSIPYKDPTIKASVISATADELSATKKVKAASIAHHPYLTVKAEKLLKKNKEGKALLKQLEDFCKKADKDGEVKELSEAAIRKRLKKGQLKRWAAAAKLPGKNQQRYPEAITFSNKAAGKKFVGVLKKKGFAARLEVSRQHGATFALVRVYGIYPDILKKKK